MLLFAEDGGYYIDLQLVMVKSPCDCVMPSPTFYIYNVSPIL